MSFEPLFYVKAVSGGAGERVDLTGRVLSFSYEDNERKADLLTLIVDNHDLSNFDDPVWKQGIELEVAWGYPDRMTPPRTVEVRSVRGFSVLNIEADGKELAANNVVKCRTFENKKRSEVVTEIAAELGFRSADVRHIEDTEERHEQIVQARLTDAQFLTRLAHKEGFVWYVDFDGFHFHQRDVTQRPARVYRYYNDPDRSEISNIVVENDVTAKPGRVRVKGRNPEAREDVEGEASNETETDRGVLAEIMSALGLGDEQDKPDKNVAQEEVRPTTETTNAAAKRVAKGRFRRAQQVAVKLTFDAEGDPNQLAKTVIALEDVGKRLSQRYYVRRVTHNISGGYTMSVECVSDGHGGHATTSDRAVGLTRVAVGRRANGKRGPRPQELPAVARALSEAQEQRAALGLEPGPLSTQEVDGKIIFKDTRGREVPPKEATKQAKQIIEDTQQRIDAALEKKGFA